MIARATRRQSLAGALAAGAAARGHSASPRRSPAASTYEDAVRETWRPMEDDPLAGDALMRELVRYATLAPSSHNTQCWKFRIRKDAIDILPDFSRRCPVVDPDDHHLFVSLGCAAENLTQAALAAGLRATPRLVREGDAPHVEVALEPCPPEKTALFQAIPCRQTTRAVYDPTPLTSAELEALERAGTAEGTGVLLVTDRARMETVLDFVIQGNSAQVRDPAFVRELKEWIRFNGRHAAATRDGLFSGCSGNPSLPVCAGRMLFPLFFREKPENDRYARQVRSSAGIAVFYSWSDDREHQVEAGRAFQRFALQAVALDIRCAHVNQPVEVPGLRGELCRALGLGDVRPDLVIRCGRGPEMPRSLRRPVEAVLL